MCELRKLSKVQHENIEELLGVVMFDDQIGTVSSWMSNGTVDEYVKGHPNVDRYSLVRL